MPSFSDIIASPPGSKFVLQGNACFALGIIHAGYRAATGYPGTPSTEVIDKSLAYAQDKIKVGWSVNEAVAVSTALGHALAGDDTVVTMKIPGVFQAADAVTTTAFFHGDGGALVIYAATDYVPSSTQHVIDARYFFASSGLPVLEPRSPQEMYDLAFTAADLSRKFRTPVVILASGILAHSEALIKTRETRIVERKNLPDNLQAWMNLPGIARANYNRAVTARIPGVKAWCETSALVSEHYGKDSWGVIVNGEAEIIVQEALQTIKADPSILSLGIAYPLPEKRILDFAGEIKGKLFIIEDGGRFLQEKIRLLGIDVIGKDDLSVITNWSPQQVLEFLGKHKVLSYKPPLPLAAKPLPRPASICPGCTYRAFSLSAARLKRKKKLYGIFGDIGCSTLLYFNGALDTVSCMGASDSIRQGVVLSRPEMANRVLSVIGDSTECHSGLDSTRNAVFRNVPGVKIILDNYTTAMTGGQPAPSSPVNLEGMPHRFDLKRAVEAEGGRTVAVDAFDVEKVDKELTEALALAEKGVFSTLILEGNCIQQTPSAKLIRSVEFAYDKCKNCDLCSICPGIETDENKKPHFTGLCTNCGGNKPVCMQRCPFDAIVFIDKTVKEQKPAVEIPNLPEIPAVTVDKDKLPASLRVAIRGIGGQGNLFFGKVLAETALRTPYADTRIVKGETHGMAQLGGPVISTFSCGEVYSPAFAPKSADAIVAMEVSEVLRPGFLELLKPGGTVILNNFKALPVGAKKEDYPSDEYINKILSGYKVLKVDALKITSEIGDKSGRSANAVVIGLLSTIPPFNAIPEGIWMSALDALSPNASAKDLNGKAFRKGRGSPFSPYAPL